MKKILLLICFILFLTTINAEEYYADIVIELQETGEARISGITNHLELSPKISQEYTSKIGETWYFDLQLKDLFSEYIYEIVLPKGSEVQIIETTNSYRITTKEEKIVIIGVGENETINVKVEYLIITNPKTPDYSFLIIIILTIILIATTYFLFKNLPKKQAPQNYDEDVLTERQIEILKLIKNKGGKITQAEIQKTLNYPKAALSRNLDSLIKKDIIEKERKGMSMLVKIKQNQTKENLSQKP